LWQQRAVACATTTSRPVYFSACGDRPAAGTDYNATSRNAYPAFSNLDDNDTYRRSHRLLKPGNGRIPGQDYFFPEG
jgi:hypothetical protein